MSRPFDERPVSPRNPQAHAAYLTTAITNAAQQAQQQMARRDANIQNDRQGVYLSFELTEDHSDALDSLTSTRRQAELAVLRQEGNVTLATFYVPQEHLAGYQEDLLGKVARYSASDGQRHRPLVTRLNDAHANTLRAVFSDDPALFPEPGVPIWWEVWTSRDGASALTSVVRQMELPVGEEHLTFPDREVFIVQATSERMDQLYVNSSAIEELRLALDSPEPFIDMPRSEQQEWTDELLERVSYEATDPEVAILLLDGGTTQAHPLLAPLLHVNDWQAYDPTWSPGEDSRFHGILGHGTKMAGLALYGDLRDAFLATQPILMKHRLEAMKVLPPTGQHRPHLFGFVTQQAVEGMEVTNPFRKRVIGMALTTRHGTRSGRPSSWSAALDQLAFGNDDEDYRRLLVVAAGNIRDPIDPTLYRDYTDLNREVTSEVESPGQAWNSLTVGAYTEKCNVPPQLHGYRAYGTAGDLSPTSRTSYAWDSQWPMKPDVVFEGGNLLTDNVITDPHPAVALLTTHHEPARTHLTDMGDTSAATALASRMAAQLYAEHPVRWPETIRGLTVHSARWTPAMQARLGRTKRDLVDAMRHYGYGVPDLQRATFSAENDVTLIAEERLQPFRLEGGEMRFNEMHFHPLPWPNIGLENLENTMLELRVTLSYYIEPNPSERGRNIRYRYASHGLRFDLRGRTEDERTFRQRMNALARQEGGYSSGTFRPPPWAIGTQTRQMAGSIFSDWWSGPAVELAACDSIAVYPTGGWWKAKARLPYSERQARYSLIVTVRTLDPTATIDIYTPIATLLEVENIVET
ncbi:S8 family peptidase [Deinococcus sp. YIM 134068]|uniref:S8 family peptidase n=1 Tax=Deinococcus lichenicola TaxID=3118910 RepID=UPI002F93C246